MNRLARERYSQPREMAKLSVDEHCRFSEQHLKQGREIAQHCSDWACVAYFYSAYHAMKAAILADPIFDDMTELKKLNPHLIPSDREAPVHKVRRGQPGFGVNNLVQLLYPSMTKSYEKLHQSSIGVRYGEGFVYPVEELEGISAGISKARVDGLLVASPL